MITDAKDADMAFGAAAAGPGTDGRYRTRDEYLDAMRALVGAGALDILLYSVTFNNDLEHDLATLEAYRVFRREAGALGMRHLLEVFNPNAPAGLAPRGVGAFVNDCIVRTLAGLTRAVLLAEAGSVRAR